MPRSAMPRTRRSPTCWWSGDKEMESSQVALRLRSGENPGPVSLEDFLKKANEDIEALV